VPSYPETAAARDRWILSRRGPRRALEAQTAYAAFVEIERSDSGELVTVATVFLTNRECPWRCLMCDLWQHTLEESVPPGAIPAQIDQALSQLPPARQIKLYNSGSFFDARAIPPADHAAIAERVRGFERVIVECHPALVGEAVLRFRDRLAGRLEVALGLETAHPQVLERLNKRLTVEQFEQAAAFLRRHDIALRVFLLVPPPFLTEAAEAWTWTQRSVDVAFDCGATVASLIPTRVGNGALEALAAEGLFVPPRLEDLEAAQEYAVGCGRGRGLADAWDLEAFSHCPACLPARRDRLMRINLSQRVEPPVPCACRTERKPILPSSGAAS